MSVVDFSEKLLEVAREVALEVAVLIPEVIASSWEEGIFDPC